MAHTDGDLLALAARISNAGRWGPDDELGTLNHISPGKRVEAASLVRTGLTVSLARPLIADASPTARVELDRRLMANPRPDERTGLPPFAAEYIGLETHQQGVTHLDAVGHVGSADGRAYGGRPFGDSLDPDGLRSGSVFAQRTGIFTRGVLLDLPAALGIEWLDATHEITPDDLEAAERSAGLRVGRGDAIVVRAGIEARELASGPSALAPGPGADAAGWMHEREIALYSGDAPEHITAAGARILGRAGSGDDGDPSPAATTRFPLVFHQLALASMGLVLLDHARVEPLALVCRDLGRYEFLFVAAPLALPGGTGSPVNPLAIF
ncbi:MAG: cyclase family protein [Candidatus Limnocylindrales bacterium]|nr:cyclase family protein [Chloroflexota bacterium]